MVKYHPIKCEVCNKRMEAHNETIRVGKNRSTFEWSDEAVMFNIRSKLGVWFCNDCWGLLLKRYNTWKKRE